MRLGAQNLAPIRSNGLIVFYYHPSLVSIAVGTRITPRPPQSRGIEARTGLRMMPTSPRSPLSFRTAGFPQYGWKAGLSGETFPVRRSAEACSRHALPDDWFVFALRASRGHYDGPLRVGPEDSIMHRLEGGYPSAPGALARVRVIVSRSVAA